MARNLPAAPPGPVEIMPSEPISIATQTSPTLAAMDPFPEAPPRRTEEERKADLKRLLVKQRREARAKLKPGERETIWICQICEFKSIFGYAPVSLIHRYNERLRSSREAALNKKRLLDKARSRGKKNKKSNSKPAPPATPSPVTDNKIVPTAQNGGKTGIDKSIGPGSNSCTCCAHRRETEERARRRRPPRPGILTQPSTAAASVTSMDESRHDLDEVVL